MKNKNSILNIAFALAIAGLVFTGCKKNDSDSALSDESTEQILNASDESRFSSASDDILDESNEVALSNSRFHGAQGIINSFHYPCNATIDSSLKNQGTITVTFHGANCKGTYTRTGTITLQLPYDAGTSTVTPWSQAGCMLSITFHDFNISRLNEDKSLTFNGMKYITNVNGGLVDDASEFSMPILHHITGMMQITFDDGTARTWNIDRNRSFARTNNVTTVTITGNANENGFSNVSIWGINRKGNNFTVTINSQVVLSSACDYNAVSGVRMHHKVIRELTVTYGVDASGNAVTSGCPYGYKLNWINRKGDAQQVVLPY